MAPRTDDFFEQVLPPIYSRIHSMSEFSGLRRSVITPNFCPRKIARLRLRLQLRSAMQTERTIPTAIANAASGDADCDCERRRRPSARLRAAMPTERPIASGDADRAPDCERRCRPTARLRAAMPTAIGDSERQC
jgi:hypothetical protein